MLTYFDAFIIGLTATPDKRTFGEYGMMKLEGMSLTELLIIYMTVGVCQ